MTSKPDERAKAAEQRKLAAEQKRDVTPPATPGTGLVQRFGLPPKPKAYLYLDEQGRYQTGITE